MRTKLGLTDHELMNSSWISLNLQMIDFPSYDPKKNKTVSDPTGSHLESLPNFKA